MKKSDSSVYAKCVTYLKPRTITFWFHVRVSLGHPQTAPSARYFLLADAGISSLSLLAMGKSP